MALVMVKMHGDALNSVFFFNDTATTEIYTLSRHDALPICGHCFSARQVQVGQQHRRPRCRELERIGPPDPPAATRSEEHTSELQSRQYLVCRLLLEKKKLRRCRRAASDFLCIHALADAAQG